MTKYRVRLKDKSLEVDLHELSGNTLSFSVEGERYLTSIERIFEQPANTSAKSRTPIGSAPPRASIPSTTQMPGGVTAPMPGIIVSITVKKGQKVEVGDVVAVMEAMKMENNIAATTSGEVKEVKVSQGQEVKGGEVLVVIG